MCGFAGYFSPNLSSASILRSGLSQGISRLTHRGPDEQNIWNSKGGHVAFGHTRLSIRDLSSAGSQPMHGFRERYVVAYNGEIYNADELRSDLCRRGYCFKGSSDTEVLVNAIEEWGVSETLKILEGMFSFSAWDDQEKKLYLCRDRLGIKPLYYTRLKGHSVAFASEIRALRFFDGFDSTISQQSLAGYLHSSCIKNSSSIFTSTHQIKPGFFSVFWLDRETIKQDSFQYWNPIEKLLGQEDTRMNSDAVDNELHDTLVRSVQSRLVSDVPVGCFLSGGIDSALIASIMSSVSESTIDTFTIGFDQAEYDESASARAVASYLGTNHHELIATGDDVVRAALDMASFHDEPFADSSQIPTYLVSELAANRVSVVLSGDGGDESFGGYNRHIAASNFLFRSMFSSPRLFRKATAKFLRLSSSVLGGINSLVPKNGLGLAKLNLDAFHVQAIAETLEYSELENLYTHITGRLGWDPDVILESPPGQTDNLVIPPELSSRKLPEQFMYLDTIGYLVEDILTKVDRCSMRHSLEARVPFLDHRVVELAWSISLQSKISGGVGKRPLRRMLDRYLPRTLYDRPKQGFGGPLVKWLNNELLEWRNDTINKAVLEDLGINWSPIEDCIEKVEQGNQQAGYRLWNILMLCQWHQTHMQL